MASTAEQQEYLTVLNTGHPGSVTYFAVGMGIDAFKRNVMVAHVTVGVPIGRDFSPVGEGPCGMSDVIDYD